MSGLVTIAGDLGTLGIGGSFITGDTIAVVAPASTWALRCGASPAISPVI